MNIFESVKQQVTIPQAAELYDVDVRGGMTMCIFHSENHPSMKIYEDHFHCFGCGAHGDVIAFAAQITGLSQLEAAQQLSSAFGISYSNEKPSVKSYVIKATQREKEQDTFCTLSDFCGMLERNRKQYAPQDENEKLHPLFTESLEKLDYYEHLSEIFSYSGKEERMKFIEENEEAINYAKKRLNEEKDRVNQIA